MAKSAQLGLQDAASPIMLQLIQFHDHAMVILTIILTFVSYAVFALMQNTFSARLILNADTVEIVWTVLPAFILLFLALPSLRLLYIMDEVNAPTITVKAVGHQWYWSYEYSDFKTLAFDSYMIPTEDLLPGQFRLLEVDNRMVVPMNTEVRVLITAADVIHAWTVPSLGVKADAVPGRLNQIGFSATRPGVFFGQCSEICGANHSFMPIAVEVVNWESFCNWIKHFSVSD
uniref:cytochrome c oxidase subunit II n=1 Tax=Pseudopotamilla reniformis TaxID=279639 RepID=UPI001FAF0225|nr:cytochrome c oxidase subunit II [Pseudopotamilla reniformis]ULD67132.1 cytochrome c oxidase subunit II [Pseudopotamilla reniformis]